MELKTIKIGHQVWMMEDLRTLKFQNHDEIPIAKSKSEWKKYSKNKKAALFLSDEFKGEVLYNYYALLDIRKLLPEGFKIPSPDDLKVLINELVPFSALKLKSKNEDWPEIAYLNPIERERKIKIGNETGFSAKPTGIVRQSGQYGCGFGAHYWSLSENNEPFVLKLVEGVETAIIVNESDLNKIGLKIFSCGLSVRGIKIDGE